MKEKGKIPSRGGIYNFLHIPLNAECPYEWCHQICNTTHSMSLQWHPRCLRDLPSSISSTPRTTMWWSLPTCAGAAGMEETTKNNAQSSQTAGTDLNPFNPKRNAVHKWAIKLAKCSHSQRMASKKLLHWGKYITIYSQFLLSINIIIFTNHKLLNFWNAHKNNTRKIKQFDLQKDTI